MTTPTMVEIITGTITTIHKMIITEIITHQISLTLVAYLEDAPHPLTQPQLG